MAKPLTEAHHQWIRDVTGGAFDPARHQSQQPEGAAPEDSQNVSEDRNRAKGLREDTAKGGDADLAARKASLKQLGDLWTKTEATIRQSVKALGVAILNEYEGDPSASQMEAELEHHTDELLRTFDGDLERSLNSAAASQTAEDLGKAMAEARAIVEEYAQFVASDARLAAMDDNPYVHTDIVATCRQTLDAMAKQLI